MFSYSFKIRRLNSSSKLKAFVTLVIDGLLEVDGFKIIDGSNGLFVSVPSHKGTITENGVSVDKYFDDVRFHGEEGLALSNEIKQAILNEYTSNTSTTSTASSSQSASNQIESRANTAKAQAGISSQKNAPAKKPPLWGF